MVLLNFYAKSVFKLNLIYEVKYLDYKVLGTKNKLNSNLHVLFFLFFFLDNLDQESF